jgi:hypothetical protein
VLRRWFIAAAGLLLLAPAAPVAGQLCAPENADAAYRAYLEAAPDGSPMEAQGRSIAAEQERRGAFDSEDTVELLDDAAFDWGYVYDCESLSYRPDTGRAGWGKGDPPDEPADEEDASEQAVTAGGTQGEADAEPPQPRSDPVASPPSSAGVPVETSGDTVRKSHRSPPASSVPDAAGDRPAGTTVGTASGPDPSGSGSFGQPVAKAAGRDTERPTRSAGGASRGIAVAVGGAMLGLGVVVVRLRRRPTRRR